jgi:pullulanase
MKKSTALLLVLIVLFSFIAPLSFAEGIEITIHYHREDGEYDNWDVWAWGGGQDGAVAFTETDAFGAIARFTVAEGTSSVGFIVRVPGWSNRETGPDWNNPGDGDRMIDLSKGSEIWVFSGQEAFLYDPPDGFGYEAREFETLEIILHRHRYDGEYAGENGAVDAAPLEKTGEDAFGAVYKAVLTGTNSRHRAKLTIGEDAAEIQLSRVPDGALSLRVYSVQGRTAVTYEPPDMTKAVKSALLDGPNLIHVTLTYPTTSRDFAITGAEGREVAIASVSGAETPYGDVFSLLTADALDPGERYTVRLQDYEPAPVVMGDYFTSEGFNDMYTYDGQLGAIYSPAQTAFKLWAPTAASAVVNLYPSGNDSDASENLPMERKEKGVWELVVQGDIKNTYYTYTVNVNGRDQTAVDPYAKAVGVNGRRGMVADLPSTDPEGWKDYERKPFTSPVDAVIYELHIRDFSINETSGMVNRGKYLAFTDTGTVNPDGLATGIDHLVDLGVTHIHLLPAFDFRSIDETKLEENKFNWGYDPENYNVPEGSYSSDPYDGNVRITEFKKMVQSMHQNGLRVVMDVVYNHTGASADSNLNKLVPNYYYRMDANGNFSNGSGCGNETASERAMVRKLIVDSVVYWVTEYHIDGFRFDLMALHDMETMEAVRAALDEIDPSIIIYGEGWTGGSTPLPANQQASKANAHLMNERIAVFSDDMRDGIKGPVYPPERANQPGFVNGHYGKREDVKFGVVASVRHPQIDYTRVSDSDGPWAKAPTQTVTYASAHDNETLWDKLVKVNPNATDEELLAMNRMSALLVLTSQGISFIHAGEELARTKGGHHNSYQSPDSVNMLRWEDKAERLELFEYYKGLIALRKNHPAFRLQTAEQVSDAVTFLNSDPQVMAYTLDGSAVGDKTFAVAVNADIKERTLKLPDSGWDVIVDGEKADGGVIMTIQGDTLTMAPKSGYVLVKTAPSDGTSGGDTTPPDETAPPPSSEEDDKSPLWWFVLGGLGVLIAVGAAVFLVVRKKK